MSPRVTESTVEEAALQWLEGLGYTIRHGPDIEPEGSHEERVAFSDVLLVARLKSSLERLNSDMPSDAREEAKRSVRVVSHVREALRNCLQLREQRRD